jgi:hypothetical protein
VELDVHISKDGVPMFPGRGSDARTNKERSIKVMIYPQREMQGGD